MDGHLFIDFTARLERLFTASSTFSRKKIDKKLFGPLIFSANPNSSTLLQSPHLAPQLPPPYPYLTLPRFLGNSNVPLRIASGLGTELPDYSSDFHGFNSLQMLQIPEKNLIVVFFPTGENSEHVGFSLLSVKDGMLSVHSKSGNFFQVAKVGNINHQRIMRLLVNPVDVFCNYESAGDISGDARSGNKCSNAADIVGLLMVCTDYCVYWHRVVINTSRKENEFSVSLNYLGCADSRAFKGKTVASACWSPHFREECLVLLKNGDFLLFAVDYSCRKMGKSSLLGKNPRVVKRKMYVSLINKLELEEKKSDEEWGWFGCEFSWYGRILIANRDEVFLVDLSTPGDCKVCSILKLEMLSVGQNDGFLALSRVTSDEFSIIVATKKLVLLFDIRKSLMPALSWPHDLQNPQYMTAFRLSELRVNCKDNNYKWASESGHCILLGSFWDNKFNLFFYGPENKGDESVYSEISKFCNSHYHWGAPLSFPLSASDCNCGSCLVREEFSRVSNPVWINWRQKNELTLGFGILDPVFSSQLLQGEDSFDGFMMIKLTSLGKLVAQSYTAAWESKKVSEVGHKRKSICLEDNLLYDHNDLEYDGKKKYQYINFEFLNAYLGDRLAECILKRKEKKDCDINARRNNLVQSKSNFDQEVCDKLKALGFPRDRTSLAVSDVLKGISWPTSIREIALMSTCAYLPANLLQLTFSTYSKFNKDLEKHKEEPLEFLDVPDDLQLPPFPFRKPSNRSNKWSRKVRPPDGLVGPICPPQFLNILHKLRIEENKDEKELYPEGSEAFSAHSQLKHQCDKVVEVIEEHFSNARSQDDDFVSLGDDTEETSGSTTKVKLCYHQPSAFSENPSRTGLTKPGCSDDTLSSYVFRKNEDLHDVGCPIELKFADCDIDLEQKGLEAFKNLNLNFQKSFKPYQDYIRKETILK